MVGRSTRNAKSHPIQMQTLRKYQLPQTMELVAGFYLADAKHLNEATQIASGIPPAKHGSIEVRPVRQLDVGNAGE